MGNTLYIDQIKIGLSCTVEKTITDQDIELFAQISTDHNPAHLDDSYAQKTRFKGRIAHGMLTASLISGIIGGQLPGDGAVYLSQNVTFLAPVCPGDHVIARACVIDMNVEKRRITLKTTCAVGNTVVLTGQAKVMVPKRGPLE